MVGQARLEPPDSGLRPATDGWFVVSVRDAAWETGAFGAACFFESDDVSRSELALRYGFGVEVATTSPAEASAPVVDWQLVRPDDWDGLPWT